MTYAKLTGKALHRATVACRALVPAAPSRKEADSAIHRIFSAIGHNIATLAFRSCNKCGDDCDWLGLAMACNVADNPPVADIVHHFAVVHFEHLTGQPYQARKATP